MTLPEEREIKYQELSSRKHGIRAVEDRGDVAMEPAQRGRLAEITELTGDREGLVTLLRERAARAILIAEMTEAWIEKQAREGVGWDKMTMLDRITTFQNGARLAINALLAVAPEERSNKDITEFLQGKAKEKGK